MVENVNQIKSGITIKIGVSAKRIRKHVCEKYYIWNPSICTCKNGNYSVITCDEILELTKAT